MGLFLKSLPIILSASAGFFYTQNNLLKITKLNLKCSITTPLNFVHLSDLHSKEFGRNNLSLKKKILSLNPDIIFTTGDMIDSNLKNLHEILDFLIDLNKYAPVVYIPGNNENRTTELNFILDTLIKNNIIVPINSIETLILKGETINILGFSERPLFVEGSRLDKIKGTYKLPNSSALLNKFEKLNGIKILLSHYPEKFSLKGDYSKYNIDLMLSGHAHGGQFILPFVGGIFAPGQGLFPKFYGGLYKKNNSSLIVSRGLGNSGFPLRLFNRPDIVNINLLPK